jgi:hypothetical protein
VQHRRDHMTLGRLYVHPGLDWRQRSGSSRTHHNQDMQLRRATLVIARCAGHAGVEHLHRHPVWLFALPAVQLNQEGQKTLPPENSNPFRRWKYATGIGLRHQPVDPRGTRYSVVHSKTFTSRWNNRCWLSPPISIR